MAKKFVISFHRNGENVHLKLVGDFDKSSACDLLEALNKYGHGTSRIFIHTNSLNKVHPFGLRMFHENLKLPGGSSLKLIFTGDNYYRFLLEPRSALNSNISAMTATS